MHLSRQAPGKQPIDPRPTELGRRQADAMNDDEIRHDTVRPRIVVMGQHLPHPEREPGSCVDTK
jgi:hypothetical protein